MNYNFLKSKKFIGLILGLLSLTLLCAFGRLTGGEFIVGFGIVVPGYFTANVMQKQVLKGVVNANVDTGKVETKEL